MSPYLVGVDLLLLYNVASMKRSVKPLHSAFAPVQSCREGRQGYVERLGAVRISAVVPLLIHFFGMSTLPGFPSLLAPFVLDASQLAVEQTVLGVGAYGKVLRGSYKSRPVAVKVRNHDAAAARATQGE